MTEDCALCGGPCAVEDGEACVTADDVRRLEGRGLLERVDPAQAEAWRLNEERRLREKYGDDPLEAATQAIDELVRALEPGARSES